MITVKVKNIWSYQSLVYKNGYRSYRKKEYVSYQNEVLDQIKELPKINNNNLVRVSLVFNSKNRTIGDLDNITKPILDFLQENGNLKNDRQVTELFLKKTFGNDENTIEIGIDKL